MFALGFPSHCDDALAAGGGGPHHPWLTTSTTVVASSPTGSAVVSLSSSPPLTDSVVRPTTYSWSTWNTDVLKVTEDGARKRGRRIAPEPMGVFQIEDPEKGWAYAWRHGEVAAWEAESWGTTRRSRRSGEAAVEIMDVVCRFERNRGFPLLGGCRVMVRVSSWGVDTAHGLDLKVFCITFLWLPVKTKP